MKLISHDFKDGDKLPNRQVFNGMGYDGDNLSPHLAWDEVPSGTKSLSSPVTIPMRRPVPAGGTGLSLTYRRIPASYRRVQAQALPICRRVQFRRVPISARRATAARHHQRARPIATSLRCMR